MASWCMVCVCVVCVSEGREQRWCWPVEENHLSDITQTRRSHLGADQVTCSYLSLSRRIRSTSLCWTLLSNSVFVCESELTEAAYEKLADETLDALAVYFEDLMEEPFTGTDFDVVISVSQSVLCHIGTFLISLCTVSINSWCIWNKAAGSLSHLDSSKNNLIATWLYVCAN